MPCRDDERVNRIVNQGLACYLAEHERTKTILHKIMTLPDAKHLAKILGVLLAFMIFLGGGIYLFTWGMLRLLDAVKDEMSKAIITGAVAVLGSAFTLVFGKLWEQRIKIRDEIRARKIPIYEGHIATFFKIFFAPKVTGKQPNQKEVMDAFAKFAEQMVTWGSSDVIKQWGKFRKIGDDMADLPPEAKLDILEDLFMSMRKDVGNDVRSLKRRDILRLFVNDIPDA